MMRLITRPLALAAMAAGAFGLAFGIGSAVSGASTASLSSTSTTAQVPTGPSAPIGSSSTAHPCPNMGGTPGTASTSAG